MATSPVHKVIRQLRNALGVRQVERLSDGELLGEFIARRDEAAFEVLPGAVSQVIEKDAQAVVGELLGTQLLPKQEGQGVLQAIGPVTNGTLAVVGLRKDVGQPADCQSS